MKEPIKSVLTSEGKKGIDSLLEKGGMSKQFGTGRKRIKGNRKSSFSSHQTIIGKPFKKKLRSDAFGLY